MSELAFNQAGDRFDLPEHVTGWRVKRMKPRGAPELVYGTDGHPLVVDRSADIDDLRTAVGTCGKYRLDPVTDDGQLAPNVPAAYVQVTATDDEKGERTATAAPIAGQDGALVEAMRLNTSLAKTIVDKYPSVMMATADMLRAADGAGLTRRQPRIIDIAAAITGDVIDENADEDDDSADEDDSAEPAAPVSPFAGIINQMIKEMIAQVTPALIAQLAPKLGGLLGNGKAPAGLLPSGKPTGASSAPSSTPPRVTEPKPATVRPPAPSAPRVSPLPVLDSATLAKLAPIYAQLAPAEVARATAIVAQLTPAEVAAFAEQLAALEPAAALAKVRAVIGSTTDKKENLEQKEETTEAAGAAS